MKGTALNGLKYEPMFPYFADRAAGGAFKVSRMEGVRCVGLAGDESFVCVCVRAS